MGKGKRLREQRASDAIKDLYPDGIKFIDDLNTECSEEFLLKLLEGAAGGFRFWLKDPYKVK